MEAAVNAFQRKVFIVLLYVSAFGGFILDFITKNRTPYFAALDGLLIVLGLTSLRFLRGTLGLIFVFLLSCFIINTSYSEASTFSSFNGFREILFLVCIALFWSKVFAEGNEELAEDYIDIIRRFGFVFLLLQIPAAFYQWSQHGPSDYVSGTLGGFNSGVLTLTVLSLIYYLHFFARNISVVVLLYLTLVPLFLNETKISFVLIPLMMVLIWVDLKAKNIILAVGGAVGLFLIFNTFYSASYLDFDDSASGIFSADFLSDYLMADIYQYDDIPRFTKIILAWQLISEQTNTFFFGLEYGLFKGGTSGEYSGFQQVYYWLLQGTRPYLYFLLMQGGLLLALGIFWLYFYLNRYFTRVNKFKMFLLVLFLLLMVYADVLRSQFFATLFFFFVFYANSDHYEKNLKSVSFL